MPAHLKLGSRPRGGFITTLLRLRFLGLQSLCVLFMASLMSAHAQVDEIVITAQKRAQSLQDVALSVSALSGEFLRENKVYEPRDLFKGMPNVSLATNATAGQLQLSIRGVNFLSFSPISVQPVLIYQDEVVFNSPQASGLFIFDLDRVEVLRGPQNTLYGRNTTGGAVNFISRKPEIGGAKSGYADVSFGNYDTYNFEGAVGGPLGTNGAYRISFQSLNTGGYWDNRTTGDEQGDREQNAMRLQYAFEPSDASAWRLQAHYANSEGGQRGIKSHGVYAVDPNTLAMGATVPPCTDIDVDDLSSSCLDLFGGPVISDNDVVTSDLRDDRDDIMAYGASATYKYDFGGFSLTSITAFEHNEYDHWEDADGLPEPFVLFRQKSESDQYSQEIRFASNDEDRFRWIVGGYLFSEETEFSTAVPIALFAPYVAGAAPQDLASFSDNNLVNHDTTMFSAFGKFDFDVSEQLTISAGLRWVSEEKDGNAQYQFAVNLDSLDVNNADAFLFQNLVSKREAGTYINRGFGETWGLWGGEFGLEYTTDNGHLIYGRVARGQKAGQFTDAPDAIANGGFFTPADEETVLSFEAGIKSEFLDRKLITSLAVFLNQYDDQQQQVTLPGPVSTVVNVASSETSGIEFDMQYAPGNGWQADLAIGVLDTEVTEDKLAELTKDGKPEERLAIRVGRELTNSPELTIGFQLRKEFELTNGTLFAATLGIDHVSERNFDILEVAASPAYVTDPSYTLVNFSAIYEFGQDNQYNLSLFGKNLTDETYYTLMQEFDIGNAILFMANPRTFGVSLGMNF